MPARTIAGRPFIKAACSSRPGAAFGGHSAHHHRRGFCNAGTGTRGVQPRRRSVPSLASPTRPAIIQRPATGGLRVRYLDGRPSLARPRSRLHGCRPVEGRTRGTTEVLCPRPAGTHRHPGGRGERPPAAAGHKVSAVRQPRHAGRRHPVVAARTLTPEETERLTRRGLRLAQFTVAYNVIEGVVAVTAGVLAGLVSVIGFGIDSGIESIAAVLVGARLAARLRHGHADEHKERLTLRLVAVTFFILAAYVTVEGIRRLIDGEAPESSPVSIGILVLALVAMPVLAAMKKRVGTRLNDNLILADAAETKICLLLSSSTLLGVGLYTLTGAAWLDPVAGFIIAAFAIYEGREAWEGELAEEGG
ncbi:cation transporter [Arthrobacter sp. PO-11]|uniref:Cation transporter n=1 Tax=Arthrobacter cavernae TaxID=2817681 RepID=A0A939KP41_9MICC|nr:cation transporter [Arthrobacter cavernae]